MVSVLFFMFLTKNLTIAINVNLMASILIKSNMPIIVATLYT